MEKLATTILEHAKATEHHRRRAALRAVASLELAKGVGVLLLGFGSGLAYAGQVVLAP